MTLKFSSRASAGYALLIVLLYTTVCTFVVSYTMIRNSNIATLNNRNNQYTAGIYAAESATEMVVAQMRADFISGGSGLVTNHLSTYRAMVPTSSQDAYWSNFEFSDGQGHVGQNYVVCISNVNGSLTSQYEGLSCYYPIYRVLSNVRMPNSRYPTLTNAVQEDVTLNSVPIFQFAIFYNSLLEFTWAAPLTVRGRVHANGNIFVGSASPLSFSNTVTCTGGIYKTNWAGHVLSDYTGSITYSGNPTYSTNVPFILLPLGTNNVHSIIDMPPTNDASTTLGQQRFCNMAQILLLVSNTSVTVNIRSSQNGNLPGLDSTPTILTNTAPLTNSASLSTNFPFLTITNTFTEWREASKTVKTTQIDVGKYAQWISTNAAVQNKLPSSQGVYPTILYVADWRTNTSGSLTAVRLTNGAAPPVDSNTNGQPMGFTVATPNPLYVWGNYNCTNSSYLGTTNTSASVPCSLICDALTILSTNWRDTNQLTFNSSGGVRVAGNTTIDAAIITGIVYTTGTGGSGFSGGVVNFPRLLEDWSSATLTLNTSMINLYASQMATNQFKNPGTYYLAPSQRNFSYDLNFSDPTKQPPPGTPNVVLLLRTGWATPPPNKVNYYVTP